MAHIIVGYVPKDIRLNTNLCSQNLQISFVAKTKKGSMLSASMQACALH